MGRPLETTAVVGQKFGRWLITAYAGKDHDRETLYHVLCDCGTKAIRRRYDLTAGRSKSCGCYQAEVKFKHGKCGAPEYKIWASMKARCFNHKDANYHNYGGRGITVCDRWLKFENFYADMGVRPGKLTLERVDNNGNYCPENCRWVTQAENNKNTRVKKALQSFTNEELLGECKRRGFEVYESGRPIL